MATSSQLGPSLTPAALRASSAKHASEAAAPPRWPIEDVVEKLGILPAAVGRGLDRLARVPVIGWIVWFFSSIWLGLTWLGLIGLYVGIGSGRADLRAYFELTDLEFFNAWPMQVLLGLMCLTLIVVTLRRVRLTLFKLGVWTVHIGILILVLGCVLYFSQKFEGLTRIFLHESVTSFYDASERALYVSKMNPDGTPGAEQMIVLPGMPIYHERLREKGDPLDRTIPAAELAKLDPALVAVPVAITGYYPDARVDPNAWKPGPPTAGIRERAIGLSLTAGGVVNENDAHWLVGTQPAARHFAFGENSFVEYLYLPKPERLETLSAEFSGGAAITVRLPKQNITRTYALDSAAPIKIEGTAYTLAPASIYPARSIITPGYQGASSDGVFFEITRRDAPDKITRWTRDIPSRFPELANDFLTVNGQMQRKKDGLLDPDIQLTFHDARADRVWVIENPANTFTLLHRQAGGKLSKTPLAPRVPTLVGLSAKTSLVLTIVGETNNAIQASRAYIRPEKSRMRKTNVTEWINRSAVELTIGKERLYVPFTPFAQTTGPLGTPPETVDLPGIGKVGFTLSTTRRPLPARLTLEQFRFVTQPGTDVPMDFYSYVTANVYKDRQLDESHALVAHLNEPAMHGGLSFFQAQWDGNPDAPDAQRFTVLGVGNRPGVHVMVAGSMLMFLGIIYAFYVKPILLQKKKKQLAQWSRGGAA